MLAVAVLQFIGCGSDKPRPTDSGNNAKTKGDSTPGVSKENFARIARGMKREEVVILLGQPEKEVKLPKDVVLLKWESKGAMVFLDKDSRVMVAVSPWNEGFGSISGQVEYDGRPLESRVSFHAGDNRVVAADTDAEGNYSVKQAPVGILKVTVELKKDNTFVNLKQYSDAKTTPLEFVVQPGENKISLQLTSSRN